MGSLLWEHQFSCLNSQNFRPDEIRTGSLTVTILQPVYSLHAVCAWSTWILQSGKFVRRRMCKRPRLLSHVITCDFLISTVLISTGLYRAVVCAPHVQR